MVKNFPGAAGSDILDQINEDLQSNWKVMSVYEPMLKKISRRPSRCHQAICWFFEALFFAKTEEIEKKYDKIVMEG